MKKRDWMNLPNLLTTIRILLVPLMLIVFFPPNQKNAVAALWVIFAAGITDCMDGYFARKYKQVTLLGKVLDPVADKLLIGGVLFCLIWSKIIHWIFFAIIAVKEIYMAIGTSICLKRNIEVQADIYGKLSTLLFYPAVLMVWPWHTYETVASIGRILLYISLAMSMIAGYHYTQRSIQAAKEMQAH